MPRVHHVKKARKDNPAAKKGEPYYWWKFRYGGKRFSATRPRPSQLTQSKWAMVLEAQEAVEDAESLDDLRSALESASETCGDCASEYEEAAEHFGGQGENQERADHLMDLQGQIDELVYKLEELDNDDEGDDDDGDTWESIKDEAVSLEWDNPA